MSDRYSVSTPPPSRSGAVASSSSAASTSRHLKRLSLSGSAFSPVSSPGDPGTVSASSASANAASPLSGRTARTAASPHSLAPEGHSPSLLRRSSSYRAAYTASPGTASTSASPAGISAGVFLATAATTPIPEVGTRHQSMTERAHPTSNRSGSAARVRRGASISYTGGSTPTRLSLDGGSNGGPLHGATPSRAPSDPPETASSAPPLSNVSPSENLPVPPAESRAQALTQPSPILSAAAGATPSPAPPSSTTPSTLLEQNADLLSIIAKKERKCLDLREELKRNEADLATLKNKWQAIVARSLQAQAYQPYVPSQHRSSPSIATTASTASPNTSPTPRPALLPHATHSLDLSLLTSTFEPADYNLDGITTPGGAGGRNGHGGDAVPMEIPESVKAAGTWLGGALGRVLEAAVGMPPPLEEEQEERRSHGDGHDGDGYEWSSTAGHHCETTTGLGIVNEEEEGEDDAASEVPGQTGATSAEGHVSGVRSSALRASSPKAMRPSRPPPPPAGSSASPSLSSPGTSPTHSRSRSAFSGLLSDKLTSRWAALSSSEVVQSSKRATLGLVDTFEQGLAHALGPLEPPPLPPFEQQQQQQQQQRRRGGEERGRGDGEVNGAAQARREDDAARAAARRLPMPGATPGQGFASLFAAASSTSPRPADHSTDKPTPA